MSSDRKSCLSYSSHPPYFPHPNPSPKDANQLIADWNRKDLWELPKTNNNRARCSNESLHKIFGNNEFESAVFAHNYYSDSSTSSINKRNSSGHTLLSTAVTSGHEHTVDALLHFGANPNKKSKNFNSSFPLHIAVQRQKLPMIKSLLNGENGRKKADLCARNGKGETALHIAVEGGDLEIVRYLLAHGASAKAKNDEGVTPWQLANARVHDSLNTREKMRAEFRRFENSETFGNRLRTWFQDLRGCLRRSLRRG